MNEKLDIYIDITYTIHGSTHWSPVSDPVCRCTPPWHQQLINLVTWVYIWRDRRGARLGGARHAHPHTPCPDILLHYTVDCECCSDEDIQGQNIGIKCLPIQLCYTLASAVQRGRDILFLCTRWSASAATISHLTHSAQHCSSVSQIQLVCYYETCFKDKANGGQKKGHTDTIPWCLLF